MCCTNSSIPPRPALPVNYRLVGRPCRRLTGLPRTTRQPPPSCAHHVDTARPSASPGPPRPSVSCPAISLWLWPLPCPHGVYTGQLTQHAGTEASLGRWPVTEELGGELEIMLHSRGPRPAAHRPPRRRPGHPVILVTERSMPISTSDSSGPSRPRILGLLRENALMGLHAHRRLPSQGSTS